MDKYLAKSNPIETLEEHTLELLKIFYDFKRKYSHLDLDWELLKQAIIHHDLGKINDYFQKKIICAINGQRYYSEKEIPHGFLSIGFIDDRNVFKDSYINYEIQNYEEIRLKILFTAIYFHHTRKNLSGDAKDIKEQIDHELDKLRDKEINFESEELKNISVKKAPSFRYFSYNILDTYNISGIDEEEKELIYLEYCKIKGLLNRIDYAASAHETMEFKNDFLKDHMENILNEFRKLDKNAHWNPLQMYMKDHTKDNLVVIAQTGMGKTEAGLLWVDSDKAFFTLPLKTAINSIFKRIIKNMSKDISDKVGLLHSDTESQYLAMEESEEREYDLEEYLFRTKQLCMPLTICTIDQIFDFVYKYLGCEYKIATLSYSKVIIDEIQMYSPDLLAVIIVALKNIVRAGGKFAILTATMPPFLVDQLRKAKIDFKFPQPFLKEEIRHSVKVLEDNINSKDIKEEYNNNKILVICNTVKSAQNLYDELVEDSKFKDKVNLFHSSFIKKDRRKIEGEILSFGSKDSKESGIWICTQVVEASLDIDFDILMTELSDINGLFQRFGRCYRSRVLEEEKYNCFLYVGSEDKSPSGIGTIIDKDIFEMSKNSIKEIDGKIGELDKQKIINQVYTSENIEKTEFFSKYESTLNYINYTFPDEKKKDEVKNIFRNINSKDIIPRSIYEKYSKEIAQSINILKRKNKDAEDIDKLKKDKIKAKQFIEDLTVSIPMYFYKSIGKEVINITNYWNLFVGDIEYDLKYGVKKKYVKVGRTPENILDRMV